MKKKNKITKKQQRFIEDLFSGEMDEEQALNKHNVSRQKYDRWQRDELFVEYFNRRIEGLDLQRCLIVARYTPLAAARLIALTESENQETARKACLDLINMRENLKGNTNKQNQSRQKIKMSPKTAAELLKIIAEEGKNV